jgi:hypothetical protein
MEGDVKMRKAALVGGMQGLLYLSLGFYLTYLTLVHITATELMWFVWIISILLINVLILINVILGEE